MRATVDIPDPPAAAKGLWFLAALVALTLHLGVVAFAIAHYEADQDELGAPAVEIGLDLVAPQATPSELPPGPDTDASKASQAVQEQKAAIKDVDLPKETPVESEDPDRIVTLDKTKEIEKVDPEVKVQEAKPSQEAVAQEARAMPTFHTAAVDTRSAAPEQGSAESRQRMRVTWQKELLAHLDRHKRYPADRSEKAAEIVLLVDLDRTGRVLAAKVLKSSGDASFDAAALSMLQRASPVPPPPPFVADEGLSFSLPVNFRVSAKR